MCFRPASASADKTCPECGTTNGMLNATCSACGADLPALEGSKTPGMPGATAAPGVPGMPAAPGAPGAPKPPAAPGAPNVG